MPFVRLSIIQKVLFGGWLCCLVACGGQTTQKEINPTNFQLFQELSPNKSKVVFENKLVENNRINILNYLYYYNGSGVAVGDLNNDGLPDLYFGSTVGKNKLFLNKGNLAFVDISLSAGVEGEYGITTGVGFVDINNDGWLDIYVCKSGREGGRYRTNELFINQGNLTFKEEAKKYGLADNSFSNQAYFFDMDVDGDLDMYLVNHPVDWLNINKVMTGEQEREGFYYEVSDKLYRNDGKGKFTDITEQAGVLNRSWGLSAAIGDYNEDGLPDIYVANDFIKPDFLYINNGNGTFTDQIKTYFPHISFFSMGTDLADINNDGLNDLYVADMAMRGHTRSKRNMGSMSTENFQTIIRRGYHYPYSTNTLQLNRGNQRFSDIGQSAGVSKTDWSWAPLLADFDNDGWKDIFVTNGIYRDIIDNDFLAKKANYEQQDKQNYFDDLVKDIPQSKIKNHLFQNKQNLSFQDQSQRWGIEKATNSNGAVYADLDMDGDLDLVVNNLNEPAQIYENQATGYLPNNYLKVKLVGTAQNINAIGASVTISYGKQEQRLDVQPARGYLSSVEPTLHFGLGDSEKVVSLTVIWPDGSQTVRKNLSVNQLVKINFAKATKNTPSPNRPEPLFADQTAAADLNHLHQEKIHDDFKAELLLPHKLSENGPFISVADVNQDGLEDFYIGGSANYEGTLYVQSATGQFAKKSNTTWATDRTYEDQQSLFFDADQDGDMDLYVVSGSNEFSNKKLYQDRLYLNDGAGNFTKATNRLPAITASGGAVAAGDFDQDGDLDLVIGGRVEPQKYPSPPQSYLLENQAGKFVDITKDKAPDLTNLGMITDLEFSDYDSDGDLDIIAVGEWLPITIFQNNAGVFDKLTEEDLGLDNTSGWWFSLTSGDVDVDGDMDYIVGNIGENNKYQPRPEKPLHIYYNDFDGNGTGDIVLSKKDKNTLFSVRGRECSSQQMPFIEQKFPNFASFATASMEEIYDPALLADAIHYQVTQFSSGLLLNRGDGTFQFQPLSELAQISPVMGNHLLDVNDDGHLDLVGAGNFFGAETETIRYDAGTGFCLLGDGKGDFLAIPNQASGLYLTGDVKGTATIRLANERTGILVGNNRGYLRLLSF
ncbi:MAG: FG-GAP-like repeat-containing protein [Bacteroidota bacterium]